MRAGHRGQPCLPWLALAVAASLGAATHRLRVTSRDLRFSPRVAWPAADVDVPAPYGSGQAGSSPQSTR